MSISTQNNDEQAYLEAVRSHSGIIARVCYCYAADVGEFDDLRQDILAALWQSWGAFRGESALSTWIYRVALNTAVGSFRRRKRRGQHVPLDSIVEPAADSGDRLADYNELHTLISRLPPRDKALILLWLDDMTYDGMAAVTGLPRNTVATRLRRAKERLKSLNS